MTAEEQTALRTARSLLEVGFDLETVLANPLIPVALRDFVRETLQHDANIELVPARTLVADHARADWLQGQDRST